jgi:hypothetical protein
MLLPKIKPIKILFLSFFIVDDGMGIMFKKIDERNREFIRRFILDYL